MRLRSAGLPLLLILGPLAAPLAGKSATTTIPIGVIASLARPGGNVTRLTLQSPELTGKRLALMVEVVAGARMAIVLVNRNNPLHDSIQGKSLSPGQPGLRTGFVLFTLCAKADPGGRPSGKARHH